MSGDILPPETLQLIVANLSCGDALAARATCKHWRHCLRDSITHLSLHTAACPGPALQRALQHLPNVCSVELRLSDCTTPADLLGALQALRQARIQEVAIREIPSPAGPRSLRRYHSSLDLTLLRGVQRLAIHSPLTWSLEDMWERVGSMASAADSSGCGNEGDVSSLQLQSLAIHSVAEASCRHTCRLRAPLPSSLTRLTTPLPGQTSPATGEICRPLATSHAGYLASLAAGLTGLQSLHLLGSCEVDVLPAFPLLTELRHAGEPRMPMFASDCHVFLRRLPRLVRLVRPFQDSPVLLSALASAPYLQHLIACLQTSQQAVPASVQSQLRSLQVLHMAKLSQAQLQQVVSVGAGLTSLALNTAGLAPFTADPGRGWPTGPRRICSLQQGLLQMTSLACLSLMVSPQLNAAFMLQQPAEVWAALPGLTRLQLRGVLLGSGAIGALGDMTGFGWRTAHDRYAAASRLQLLHVRDLPPRGLRQLELSHYAIVLQPAAQPADLTDGFAWLNLGSQQPQQQQAQPRDHIGASGSGSSSHQAPAAGCAASQGLSQLQRLVLAHCACFAADRAAASDRAAVAAGDAAAVAGATAALQQLLRLLPQDGQLRELQLVAVPAAPAALTLIGQQLTGGLRQLHLLPVSSSPVQAPARQAVPQQAWDAAATDFARQARHHGGQLRDLQLALPAGNSNSACCSTHACCSISSLTRLQLQLDVSAADVSGGCCWQAAAGQRNSSSSSIASWAASLCHLRVLDVVAVRVSSLVANSCLNNLRELFLRRVPAELPACEVLYREEAEA